MDDLFDAFDLSSEDRLRMRMSDSKRRQGHLLLRVSAVLVAFALVGTVLGMQQIPGYVAQTLAPLHQLTDTLHSLS